MNKKRRPNSRKSSKPKPRKQKFLSLRLQFPANDTGKTKRLSEMLPATTSAASPAARITSHQLNLFPTKSENQVEDHDHENVEFLFSTVDGGATSLTSLLNTATTCNSSHGTSTISSRNDELSPSSASLTYACGGDDSESGAAAFVRKAMRSRERISGEEKWVCYSEVVERTVKVKVKEEEVTSSAVIVPTGGNDPAGIRRLALKLDYKGILNAWCDKGPLYVHSESSQIVPDVNDELFSPDDGTSWGCTWGLWTVPTMVKTENYNSEFKMKCEDYELKKGHREASVLRYKEKRHLRLFSNQIRYEVRKLNAQKRPRLKGRFVKSVED